MRFPLDTLHAFEIAAETESFSATARSLNLTDSAISHQIRKLEDSLGTALFERHGRSIRLSTEGKLFLTTVKPLLSAVRDSARVLHRSSASKGVVTIACSSMFGSKWLSRHLPDFFERHANVGCNLKLLDNERVAGEADADVGIVFSGTTWPDKICIVLGKVGLAPVCSPRLFSDRDALPRKPQDLVEYPMIHGDDGVEWGEWLEKANGPSLSAFERHVYCNDTGFAIDLAYHGGGVTLTSDELAGSYIKDGTLIRPFSTTTKAAGAWYAICSPKRFNEPRVQIFLNWIVGYFGATVPEPQP